jgi:hypothetical protein
MSEPLETDPGLYDGSRKFGKHLQKRQLDIPEYGASFVNYKALKKVHFSSDAAVENPAMLMV